MRTARLLVLALGLLASPALAQPEFFFGTGEAPVFREEAIDKRFLRTRLFQALDQGTADANCAQVVGAYLTLLGEVGTQFHKRDENFMLDPALVQALNTQLVTDRFPGNSYFVTMVRRVLIDKQLRPDWLKTAESLVPYYPAIDMARLRFLADGTKPVDSFLLTLPVLRERYKEEVQRVNSVAVSTAEALFRDNYLDHELAFSGLELVDVKLEKPKKKKLKKGEEPEPERMVARLIWTEPEPAPTATYEFQFGKPRKRERVEVVAILQDKQYVDLNKLLKGNTVLVRGRFWEYKKGLSSIELRDALLFQERDWARIGGLVEPMALASCPLAVNDLTGIAPVQPGAFGSKPR
ncbi:hypothetical protein OWM54_02375 [Myxococcus sp. MISCRS1]|uniref:hypothetical protein n=1 Tax=Myxococcus TaxID=32 RepID=UPI0011443938|nr:MULTISPECIES: hypothetical protein [Myxococcus]BDT34044.1 hypothetical protein MFMH1_37130 [Myxococcus sp. MH1]MBZ4399919.1 hypothetical protein [Myxococcus sp. AS-1-15]MBZ4414212.1 hypothetical protein [Myxococcus sp. XM-1-1-1]MCK8496840.1 hypothetical protein [Myxococcus fulvus]MCY0995975.1 hypothetical protein [Myxococcus sp. MISCRS1]